jgi:hypothetical protein
MKKPFVLPLFLGLALLLSVAADLAAQGKTVTVPKGTKVEKLGPGNFKLTTPEGSVFKITAYKKTGKTAGTPGAAGIIGDCGIYDAKGKLVATGTGGVLKNGANPGKAGKSLPPADYIKIDDEITWLPATIEFPTIRVFNRQALNKLSPQPDPPGKGD